MIPCAMPTIYVTGHRNPDTDSIAAAVGYAELLRRLDPNDDYVAVRLGDLNSQTKWVLEEAGVDEPELLRHILLRARDVMQESFCMVGGDEPVREVGITMARQDLDLVPVVDDDGMLEGVVTERAFARRYIRESRQASSLVDAPTAVDAIVEALGGELLAGEADKLVAGRVWVYAMEQGWSDSGIAEGDVVVIGNRDEEQRRAIETGVGLLVTSNGVNPPQEVLDFARERGTAVVGSPLDSYVTGRMITLAAPCRALMDGEPLTVGPDDVVADITEAIKEVHYRAAIVTDRQRRPVGLVTRTDLVSPEPRKVVLVDHAEQAQSVAGIEEAEIVEILDHHH